MSTDQVREAHHYKNHACTCCFVTCEIKTQRIVDDCTTALSVAKSWTRSLGSIATNKQEKEDKHKQ